MKLPKLVWWTLLAILLFLVLMMAYRLVISYVMMNKLSPVSYSTVLWYGFLFDLRYAAGFSILLYLPGLLRPIHPFRSHQGKWLAIWGYSVFGAFLMLVYGFDLAHLVAFDIRIQPDLFRRLRKGGQDAILFQRNAPWVIILLLASAGAAFIHFLLLMMYNFVRSRKRPEGKRPMLAKGLMLAFLVLAVWGSISGLPLSAKHLDHWKNETAIKAAINPLESLLFPYYKK